MTRRASRTAAASAARTDADYRLFTRSRHRRAAVSGPATWRNPDPAAALRSSSTAHNDEIDRDLAVLAKLRVGSEDQQHDRDETRGVRSTWDNRPSWDNWRKHK